MKIFDGPYYIINKRLLTMVGIWPYLSRLHKNISLVIITIISFSLMIPLIAEQIVSWSNDKILVMESAVGFLYLVVAYSKYFSAYLFEDRIKLVYEQIVEDWQSINDEDEINILHQFSQRGRFLTIVYMSCAVIGVIIFTWFPFIPFALDLIFPAHKPHKRIYLQRPYYLVVDDVDYYYEFFLGHSTPVFVTMTIVAASIDSMVAASIMHVCGLFAIVCYRLERIGKREKPGDSHLANDVEVYDCIRKVCNMHLNSLKSVERIQHSFSISFFFMLVLGSIIVAILIFDVLLIYLEFPLRASIGVIIIIGIKICIFYSIWIIQNVINSSEEVFMSAYFSEWYNLSVDARKLIFIVLQKSLKPCRVVACNMCEMNVQTFATVLKASLSYATVMLSVQRDGQFRRQI